MKPLSRMQWLVWCCWVGGMSQQQTAYSLGLTYNTVYSYRKEIRAKGRKPVWAL